MKAKMAVWTGQTPETCDFCSRPLEKSFIDGKTSIGHWGLMCVTCHKIIGCGLGEGRGQLYNLETKVKVRG